MVLFHSVTSLLFSQTLTEVVDASPFQLNFEFTPGQEYCAVAHFASSPLSKTQCLHIPLGKQCFIQFICSFFIMLLTRRCHKAPDIYLFVTSQLELTMAWKISEMKFAVLLDSVEISFQSLANFLPFCFFF